MIDREKVIKGLTCCTSADGCYECPYKDERDEIYSGFCEQVLKHDALALLKEQEQEISRLKNHVDCDVAETTPSGCTGYGRGFNDDEPCETCKKCEAYVGYDEE